MYFCHSNMVLVSNLSLSVDVMKGSDSFMTHCLESSQVLLNNVMESREFLAGSIFEQDSFYNHTNVCLVRAVGSRSVP